MYYEARLQVVRMADDDGSNETAVTPANVAEWVRVANAVYAPARLRILFDPVNDFVTRRNTRLNQLVAASGLQQDTDAVIDADDIANQFQDRVVVICRTSRPFVGGASGPGSGFAGYPERRVIMPPFDPNGVTLFAHELGHYLGLPHTFYGEVNTVDEARTLFERVGITALDSDVSLVNDTPPELIVRDLDAGTATSIVFDGQTISLLRDNIMSYYRPLSPNGKTITAGQAERVLAVLQARGNGGLQVLEWQDDWRWCNRCHGLFYSRGQSVAGTCPAGGQHDKTVSGNYALANTLSFSGQSDWRWCKKCQGLFFAEGQSAAGTCPAGGQHDRAVSGNYVLANFVWAFPGQADWRWCRKCRGLFYSGGQSSAGACPAGGQHDKTVSANYALANDRPAFPSQPDWRWCHKCQGLFFAGGRNLAGTCPAQGQHDKTLSGNYALAHNTAGFAGQSDWRWCHKCQGLFFSGGQSSAGVCAAGGQHTRTISQDYALAHNAPGFAGQSDWRACHKCQGLFYSGGQNPAGTCPAGGRHDKAASGTYTLRHA